MDMTKDSRSTPITQMRNFKNMQQRTCMMQWLGCITNTGFEIIVDDPNGIEIEKRSVFREQSEPDISCIRVTCVGRKTHTEPAAAKLLHQCYMLQAYNADAPADIINGACKYFKSAADVHGYRCTCTVDGVPVPVQGRRGCVVTVLVPWPWHRDPQDSAAYMVSWSTPFNAYFNNGGITPK